MDSKIQDQVGAQEAGRSSLHEVLDARCVFCGYNGAGYWQPFTHPKPCPWHDIGGMDQRIRELRRIIHAHYVRASNVEVARESGEKRS